MEELTLGQISLTIAFIVALVGGVKYVLNDMKKIMDKALKPTNDKIDHIEKKLTDEMNKIDMNATKNFLVSRLHEIKKNDDVLDDVTKERFFEQYEHYKNLGGNSYIANEVERLRKEGRL